MNCILCQEEGGNVLWRDEFCRIVRIPGTDYPDLCRVILNRHVREMTDLPDEDKSRLMRAVFATEAALRELVRPDKINLASFGNQVPHLHWHVIPRTGDDPHFPDPTWGPAKRPAPPCRVEVSDAALASRLAALMD